MAISQDPTPTKTIPPAGGLKKRQARENRKRENRIRPVELTCQAKKKKEAKGRDIFQK